MELVSALKVNWPLYHGEIKLSWLVLQPEGHKWYGICPTNISESELSLLNVYLKPLSSVLFSKKSGLRCWPKSSRFFGSGYNVYAFNKTISPQLKIWQFFLLPKELGQFSYFKKTSRLSKKLFFQFQKEFLHKWLEPAGTSRKYREEYGLLAHQLKSPVISIKRHLSVIQEKYPEEKDVIKEEEVKLSQLQQYIDTQLSLYKGFEQKIKNASVDVYELIQQLELFFYPVFREKKPRFIPDIPSPKNKPPVLIKGRFEWVFQALHNIVENALSFCGKNGWVKIKLKVLTHSISISISDSGPGVSDVSIPNLFQPFFTTRQGGSGVGLYFAKQIINRHEGSLQYFPGSAEERHCFRIRFPRFKQEKTLQLTGEHHEK